MITFKKNILNIRNNQNKDFNNVPVIVGKSAYEIAKEHGFQGTEKEWIESIRKNNGFVEKAGRVVTTNALKLDHEIGDETTPVYINEDGIPVPVDYSLGNSCELNATDDPDAKGRYVVTTKALREALKDLEKIKGSVYNKCIVPSPSILVYNDNEQSPEWANLNNDILSISGTTKAVYAGTYTAIFTPVPPYRWVNGSKEPMSVLWKIEKLDIVATVDKDIINLNNDNISESVKVTKLGTGIVTATTSNTNIATVSVNGNIVTITGNQEYEGTATIIIEVSEDINYKVPKNIIINVTANYQ